MGWTSWGRGQKVPAFPGRNHRGGRAKKGRSIKDRVFFFSGCASGEGKGGKGRRSAKKTTGGLKGLVEERVGVALSRRVGVKFSSSQRGRSERKRGEGEKRKEARLYKREFLVHL